MKIAVCMKGTESSPADRAALGVGLGIRRRLSGVRLEVFSVCDDDRLEALYLARASGADAVQRIVPPGRWRGHSATALALAARLCGETRGARAFGDPFDLVLCGGQTPGEPADLVGQLLAELLELAPVKDVCNVRERRRDALIVDHRLGSGDAQTAEVQLPALLTTTADAAPAPHVAERRLLAARQQPIRAWQLEWNGDLPRVPRWNDERGPDASRAVN